MPALRWWTAAFVLLATQAWAAEPILPTLSGRVVDQANILSATARAQLTDELAAHERATSNQVVVVTLRSLQGYEIEDFSVRLGRQWHLGHQDRNNGVLLVIAPNERRVRIEVGYGLEGALPDITANTIIQSEILPRFRAGDFEGGIVRGTRSILGAITGTYQPRSGRTDDPQYDTVAILIFGLFVMMILYNFYYRYSGAAQRRGPWDPVGGGVFWPGSRGGSGGGQRSGGGRFGGFGGSFGGGGASGRW